MSVIRKRTSQGQEFRLTGLGSKEFDLVVRADKNAKNIML